MRSVHSTLAFAGRLEGTGSSFVYDGVGNLLVEAGPHGTVTYTWDGGNRLVQLEDGDRVEQYEYDAAGLRQTRVTAEGTTNFLWDGVHLLAELDEDGEPLAQYVTRPDGWGGLISQQRGDEVRFYHHDGSGNVRALVDEQGAVTDWYAHSAFGQRISASGATANRFGFGGEQGYQDEGGDRAYVRARYYSAEHGRWLSADPLDPMGPGRFQYVGNSPVNRMDPSGLMTAEEEGRVARLYGAGSGAVEAGLHAALRAGARAAERARLRRNSAALGRQRHPAPSGPAPNRIGPVPIDTARLRAAAAAAPSMHELKTNYQTEMQRAHVEGIVYSFVASWLDIQVAILTPLTAMGDAISFGLSALLRNPVHVQNDIDENSWWYRLFYDVGFVTRDVMITHYAMLGVGSLSKLRAYMKAPLLYETGQLTLTEEAWVKMGEAGVDLADPVAKGRYLRNLMRTEGPLHFPRGNCWTLAKLATGPTPGGGVLVLSLEATELGYRYGRWRRSHLGRRRQAPR